MLQRLRRGRNVRSRFVESHISKTLAFQIRSLRDKEGWSQQRLAEKIDSNQNAIYRAENPNYGKQTLTTLKKIAAAFDVALIVRFVPFSELADWVSGTPRIDIGLSMNALAVPCFDIEFSEEPKVVSPARDFPTGPSVPLPSSSALGVARTNLFQTQTIGAGVALDTSPSDPQLRVTTDLPSALLRGAAGLGPPVVEAPHT